MKIKQLFQSLQVDGYGGTEIKNNWYLDLQKKMLQKIFKVYWYLLAAAAHNQHKKFNFNQQGGPCLLDLDYLDSINPYMQIDLLGLGWWISMKFSRGVHISTRIIVDYTSRNSDKGNQTSVLEQNHKQLLYQRDFCHPCNTAREDLTRQVLDWIDNGENIFLYNDVNEFS